MGKILDIIEKYSGGKCFYSDRYSLDNIFPPEFEDKDEEFRSDKIFETNNKLGKNIQIDHTQSASSIFSYFLDGSRRTYKIADFASNDNKFLPIIGGQIGAAICIRKNKRLKKYQLLKKNVLAVPDRMGGESERINNEIKMLKKHNLSIDQLLVYQYKVNPDRTFENIAIAKIQFHMLSMEIELLTTMVHSNALSTDSMLIIDGSLQFSGINEEDEYIFQNVIGISKTFNPHLQGILKTKKKEIGHHLTSLNFGERTSVYVYEPEGIGKRRLKIGAWYLRIRPNQYSMNPLDGVIKIEKIATSRREKSDGFESDLVDEISRAILLERNVTCYGNDKRWANHLYPIYLTELLLKSSFVNDHFFVNIF
jgi:hypothetical protein